MRCNKRIQIAVKTAAGAMAVFLASGAARAASVTLDSSADTYIAPVLFGGDSNHGSENRLWMEGFQPANNPLMYLTIPLVRFDLSGYAGQTVVGTPTVQLFLNDSNGENDAVTQTIDARQSLVGWQENTVTWNNFGGSGFQDSDQGPILSTDVVNWGADKFSYVSWTLSAPLVQSWIDNGAGNFGLLFRGSTPTGSTSLLFSSREGANAPQLIFDTAPTSPSGAPLPSSAGGGAVLLAGLAVAGWFRCGKRSPRRA